MNGVIDGSLVALALLASGGYVLLSLGPRSLRRRLLGALSQAAARLPAFLGLRRMAQRLPAYARQARLARRGWAGCGSRRAGTQKPADVEVRGPVGHNVRR